MSKSLPNAHKPGKRRKDDGKGNENKGRGGETKYELDPKAVKSYQASCGDCGSLGLYLNPGDATRAEQQHQASRHQNTPQRPTVTGGVHGKQNERNKGRK